MKNSNIDKAKSELIREVNRLRDELAQSIKLASPSEEQPSESEELFAAVLSDANDGLWDCNYEKGTAYFSPRWKKMFGYEDHELENTLGTWSMLMHPEDKLDIDRRLGGKRIVNDGPMEIELRMRHKEGHEVIISSRPFLVKCDPDGKLIRIAGTNVDITERKRVAAYSSYNVKILKMVAIGRPASEIYDEIALMYESRHPGMRCSMLELHGSTLLHGGAPSLPKEYCDAVNGLEYGPNVGSCGTSTYTGKRVLVENIETDPKWQNIKSCALPHGMRCCWSEPIKDSSGKVLGAFGMYYDYPALPNDEESDDLKAAARLAGIVMERDQAQKRIRQLAYIDELTGLPSRASFYQNLDELIQTSKDHHNHFSLLYIDLDDFKGVNDSLGHDVGDSLLKEISTRLAGIDFGIDYIARLSGDEFCVLAGGSEKEAREIAQRCLEVVATPIELSARRLSPTCSIGIARYPDDAKDLSTLLKAADTSLYAAKESGKSQYAFYQPELTERAEYRFQVEQYLREAVDKGQLSLVYQPQINIRSGDIIGVEALCRWHHPILGEVPPTDFIPTAERVGIIKPLTEWVLYRACRQLVAWKKQGLPALQMAVNISPSHLLGREIISLVERVIEETGIEPAELELEVTESVVQTDQKNLSTFQDLKQIGVSLAIDDFGTGYSSFASLKHLKVDCLKIDKYFIDDILTDKKTRLLVGAMIDMGHSLGHGIIAEGVEKPEQLKILDDLGCDLMQGFVFSQAVSAEEISSLLNDERRISLTS